MEADDLLHGSLEQPLSFSLYKSHIRNPMKIHQTFNILKPRSNSLPTHHISSMGLLQAPPPPLRRSYPPYPLRPPPQPPLLPLPAGYPRLSSAALSPSCSHTPKKSTKSSSKIPKNEAKRARKRSPDSSTSNLGSNSKELPKNIVKYSHVDSTGNKYYGNDNSVVELMINSSGPLNDMEDQEDLLPGSVVFTISPPPSSLPLPTFSLRPKLSCNPVAAGVDTGATDDLRRLLRLQ